MNISNEVNEKERLQSVRSYRVINDTAKQDFDQIARVAALLCDAPVVLVSLMEDCKQLFLSHYGLSLTEVPREETFCEVLVKNPNEPLIVPDARADERFINNRYVTGYPKIVFYAGFPIINSQGHVLGTLCIIDHKMRNISLQQKEGLVCLTNQILQIFELQKKSYDLEISKSLLKINSDRLSNIIEASNVGTWEWNVKTGEARFNEQWAKMLGYTLRELEPITIDTWNRLTHPDDLEILNKSLKEYFNGITDFFECECRLKHKKGHWVWILDRGKVISWGKDGKPEMMFGTHVDITQRKIASQQLAHTNENLKMAQRLAQLVYWQIDLKNDTSYWSDQIYEIWNLDKNTTIFNTDLFLSRVHSEDARIIEERMFSPKFETNQNYEFRTVHPDGSIKWLRGSGKNNVSSSPQFLEGTFQDITAQKQLELSLMESEKRYSNLFQLTPIPTWVYDINTFKITTVNKAALDAYGYSEKEFLSMTIKDLRPVEDIPKLLLAIKDTKNNVGKYKVGVYTHRKKDSSIFKVEVHSNQLFVSGGKSRVVMAINISETLNYIEAIEEKNSTLQEIARIQSHVVRAPLAKMLGIIDILKIDKTLPSEQEGNFMDELLNSANDLDNIIRTISDKASQLEKV